MFRSDCKVIFRSDCNVIFRSDWNVIPHSRDYFLANLVTVLFVCLVSYSFSRKQSTRPIYKKLHHNSYVKVQ